VTSDFINNTGGTDFSKDCEDWKSLLKVTKNGFDDFTIQCVDNSLKIVVPTPDPKTAQSPSIEPKENFWTDGRVAGVAVGSALGLAAIVGTVLLVDYVRSKKKVRRVHPKRDENQDEEEETQELSDEAGMESPRKDLLDEAPLEPESDNE
jgi:hypothetical protein